MPSRAAVEAPGPSGEQGPPAPSAAAVPPRAHVGHGRHARRGRVGLGARIGSMVGVDAAVAVAVGAGVVALRLGFAAAQPTDWDAAQYAAGTLHFDVRHGSPHPPGYFLFVMAGRGVHALTGLGPVAALVVVAAVASGLAAAATWLVGVELGGRGAAGRWVGAAAVALTALSPVAWFYGAIISPYSFDALVACLLVLAARRARPGSWHGVAAVVVLGLGIGARQSMAEMFVPLALLAVAGSTRSWRRLGTTVVAGAASVVVWLVPMVTAQPGGFAAWEHATRAEAAGAVAASSIFDTTSGGLTNLGTVAALAVLGLGAAALVGVAGTGAVAGWELSRLARRRGRADGTAGAVARSGVADAVAGDGAAGGRTGRLTRPWYQRAGVVLAAAIVPPVLVVSLEAFDKPGYMLAYLPTATVALLLPVAALLRRLRRRGRTVAGVALGVLAAAGAALGVQRFVAGQAILPASALGRPGLWLDQPRYGAPYPLTAAAIRAADTGDVALRRLGPLVDARRDVVVLVSTEGGPAVFRDLGWELPGLRVALVYPPSVVYQEQRTLLYYATGSTLRVPPGGVGWFLVQPGSPTMTAAASAGKAVEVGRVDGFAVWRVEPGTTVYGVALRRGTPARPLGGGA